MNQCNFIGRLGKAPEPIGSSGAKFSLAIDGYDYQAKQKKTTWIDFVSFGKTAERVQQYLEAGSQVRVTARFDWRERDHNGTHYRDPSFVAEDVEFLAKSSKQTIQQGGFGAQTGPQQDPEQPLW